MHRITVAERRARLAVRHHVAPGARAAPVLQAARDVVCLHASDPATVYVSARARMVDGTIEAVDRALCEDHELVRIVGGWAVRPAGEVVSRILEDVGHEAERAVAAEAATLTSWYRSVRTVPRFLSPLYGELVG